MDAHREPGTGWADVEDHDGYLLSWLPTHLHGAGLHDELSTLLGGRHRLARKATHLGLDGLLGDLTLAAAPDRGHG